MSITDGKYLRRGGGYPGVAVRLGLGFKVLERSQRAKRAQNPEQTKQTHRPSASPPANELGGGVNETDEYQ